MKHHTKVIWFLPIICLNIWQCAPLTTFEEGRTLEKDRIDLKISMNVGAGTEYERTLDNEEYFQGTMSMGIGLTNNLEMGPRMDASTMISLYTKYQLLGTKTSTHAGSILMEIGGTPIELLLDRFRYFSTAAWCHSIYVNDHFAINISPRIWYFNDAQFDNLGLNPSPGTTSEDLSLGLNYGLRFGNKFRFITEIAHLDLRTFQISRVGVGIGFVF